MSVRTELKLFLWIQASIYTRQIPVFLSSTLSNNYSSCLKVKSLKFGVVYMELSPLIVLYEKQYTIFTSDLIPLYDITLPSMTCLQNADRNLGTMEKKMLVIL